MIIAVIGSVLLFLIVLLYLLLALGFPFGYLAWGGNYPDVLPKNMRVQTAVSIPAQLFAIFVLLSLGGVFGLEAGTVTTVFGYIFMVFFVINTLMNLYSKSKKEKIIMSPIAFIVALSYFYVLVIK